jgi:hypothetical protein
VGEEGEDASVRPNQIFAVSLTPDLLPPHRARSVYWTVRRQLLTPFGLRTLDARDPRYRGRCEGSSRDRDLAAHQGAVWPCSCPRGRRRVRFGDVRRRPSPHASRLLRARRERGRGGAGFDELCLSYQFSVFSSQFSVLN